MIVLDTNIVLDLYVFQDPANQALKQAVETQQLIWLATPPMRAELARVLTYPHLLPRLAQHHLSAEQVLAQFDRHAQITAIALKASVTCRDADDQCFIDLAVEHKAHLYSKDRAVLCMKKRLARLGVTVTTSLRIY